MTDTKLLYPLDVEKGDTLANVMRRRIADSILSGQCKPGTRLEERTLAEQFGVSRTPVREALQQLVMSGLAVSKPRSGTVVIEIEPSRVSSLCEALILLETLCARLAATRITAVELGRLYKVHATCAKFHEENDADGYAAENRKFHSAVIAATQNCDLAETVEFCRLRIAPFQRLPFRFSEHRTTCQKEHKLVLEALEKSDPDLAARRMTEHLTTLSLAIDDCLQKL